MSDETAALIAELKTYLPDPVKRIELYDFIMGEVADAIGSFHDLPMAFSSKRSEYEEYAQRVTAYEQGMARLLNLLVVGTFHSITSEHDRLWVRCVDRLASRKTEDSGATVLIEMQQYPTLLALFAIGLGGIAGDRLDSIAHVMASASIYDTSLSSRVGVSIGTVGSLHADAMKRAFPDLARHKTPISDHILEVLRKPVSDFTPSDERLDDYFDEFEYLLGIVYAAHQGSGWGPVGRAAWRWARRNRPPGEMVDRHPDVLISTRLFKDAKDLADAQQTYGELLRASPLRY